MTKSTIIFLYGNIIWPFYLLWGNKVMIVTAKSINHGLVVLFQYHTTLIVPYKFSMNSVRNSQTGPQLTYYSMEDTFHSIQNYINTSTLEWVLSECLRIGMASHILKNIPPDKVHVVFLMTRDTKNQLNLGPETFNKLKIYIGKCAQNFLRYENHPIFQLIEDSQLNKALYFYFLLKNNNQQSNYGIVQLSSRQMNLIYPLSKNDQFNTTFYNNNKYIDEFTNYNNISNQIFSTTTYCDGFTNVFEILMVIIIRNHIDNKQKKNYVNNPCFPNGGIYSINTKDISNICNKYIYISDFKEKYNFKGKFNKKKCIALLDLVYKSKNTTIQSNNIPSHINYIIVDYKLKNNMPFVITDLFEFIKMYNISTFSMIEALVKSNCNIKINPSNYRTELESHIKIMECFNAVIILYNIKYLLKINESFIQLPNVFIKTSLGLGYFDPRLHGVDDLIEVKPNKKKNIIFSILIFFIGPSLLVLFIITILLVYVKKRKKTILQLPIHHHTNK